MGREDIYIYIYIYIFGSHCMYLGSLELGLQCLNGEGLLCDLRVESLMLVFTMLQCFLQLVQFCFQFAS